MVQAGEELRHCNSYVYLHWETVEEKKQVATQRPTEILQEYLNI